MVCQARSKMLQESKSLMLPFFHTYLKVVLFIDGVLDLRTFDDPWLHPGDHIRALHHCLVLHLGEQGLECLVSRRAESRDLNDASQIGLRQASKSKKDLSEFAIQRLYATVDDQKRNTDCCECCKLDVHSFLLSCASINDPMKDYMDFQRF